MKFYDKYILPKITHFACSTGPAMKQRAKIVPLASGKVLEVGIGSGLNIPFYDASKVEMLFGLEPSPEMMSLAKKRKARGDIPVEFLECPAEQIPLEDDLVDSVVITYTMCTIPDPITALAEMRRVLKPGGKLLFCEHGIAPDRSVERCQYFLNPVWKRLGGGCNLNRPIPVLIERGGFEITWMDTMYLPGFKPAGFNYWGVAVHKQPIA